MDKASELQKVAKEIEKCPICKKGKVGKAVPGEGSPNAKIVFVGEAPGKLESLTGRPFVGRSGKFLRELISSVGLKESEIFITSPVKYLPKYGTPKLSDIAHGNVHFKKQLEIINPKIIVLLGSIASFATLGEKIPILKSHGNVIERDNKTYFVTLHPAAVVRIQKNKPLMVSDFKKLKRLVDKTI